MFDELWQEIQDAPGEIFDMDILELREFANKNEFDEDSFGYDDLADGLSLDSNYDF